MVALKFSVRAFDTKALRREYERERRQQIRGAHEVAEIQSKKAQRHVQATMRSVGLGRLANAVGHTSSKRKKQLERTPYGVIYARGSREGRGAGALEAYSTGVAIYPRKGRWLAFPTSAAPRFVSAGGRRQRLTPALWKQAGLDQRIGKLFFRQVKANLALLLVNRVSLSPKTGQARRLGKSGRTRTRIAQKQAVPIFILIPYTRRAKRFDQRKIMEFYAERTPDALRRWYRDYDRRAG